MSIIQSKRGTSSKNCPWCWRSKLEYRATARSVAFSCLAKCGYRANTPRGELTKEDRQEIYGEAPKPEEPTLEIACGKIEGV